MSLSIMNIMKSNMTGSNIALLQLAESVSYNNYIQPVCVKLSSSRPFPIGSQCWVAGWRHTTRGVKVGSGLRDLETEVTSCGIVSDSENICTFTMDMQRGDQGGPLLCKSDSSWFQVAVVTVDGSKSVHEDVQVFAKTARFGSFMKETVGNMPSPAANPTTGDAPGYSISFLISFTVPVISIFLLSGS
ncbi:hypothetical protein LDENG_00295840 [Lucifuga dentata]|nr:hypothetical protein LDENG_00295840 [Lucifuga dentata]